MHQAPESPAKTKRPSMQFYPGDWQRDTALRLCSIGARGLWIEMICVMHQADPYGYLVVNGRPIAPDALARMVGCSPAECKRWIAELEGAGVFNRDGDVIVSRRMVRDEHIRRLRAQGGKLGGNPNLVPNLNGPPKVIEKVNLPPTLHPTPSSSSSSSSSLKERTTKSSKLDDARLVLDFLNKVTDRHYEPVEANLRPISARLSETSVEEVKQVVACKAEQWLGGEMDKYLRPATLFNATKFHQYLAEARQVNGANHGL